MQLDAQAQQLLLRARTLAQENRQWCCTHLNVICAFVEHQEDEAAVKLVNACRISASRCERQQEGLPELQKSWAETLESASHGRVLTRDELMDLACAQDLPAVVQKRLQEWRNPTPPSEPSAKQDAPGKPEVEWQRLEWDDGSHLHVVELTCVGAVVHQRTLRTSVKTGRLVDKPVVEIKTHPSDANARSRVQQRIVHLQKKDYQLRGPVLAPLPEHSTPNEQRWEREERRKNLARFEDRAVGFFKEWVAMGFDPARSFHQEGQRLKKDWNQIALDCINLASRHFHVSFRQRTEVDEEHGTLGSIWKRNLAEFYVEPARVARLAEAKMRGEFGNHDGEYPEWKPSNHVSPVIRDATTRALERAQRG